MIAAGAMLRSVAPEIHAEPRILGSIFRINRDIRVSKDKRPYKDHIDFWFWEGERKHAVSGFFVRIGPKLVGIGAGCHGFDRDQMQAFRRAAVDTAALRSLGEVASQLTRDGYQLSGEATPKARFLYVHVDASPDLALQPALLMSCESHWRRLAPLHRWLVDYVQRPLAPV